MGLTLSIFLLGAAAYNYGSRPVYQATAVISLDDVGVATLKARPTVDQARKMSATEEQVRSLKSPEMALLAIRNIDPVVAAELSLGPLGDATDRMIEETRTALGFPVTHGTTSTDLVDTFRSRLTVEYQPPAAWIYLRFMAYDANAAAMAANHLAETYLAEITRQTEGDAGATRREMEQKVAERQVRASESLGKLQSLGDEEGLADIERRRELLEQELARLQESLIAVRQTRLAKRALVEESRRLSGTDMLSIPSIRDDRETIEVSGRIADLNSQLAAATATLGDRHPDIVALRHELETERRRLNFRIATLRESIAQEDRLTRRQEADILAAIASAQKKLPPLQKNSIERSFLQKQAEARERSVSEIIDKSVRVADEEITLAPALIQRAEVPSIPISPQRARNFQYAVVLGLLVGFGLIWLRSHLDETLKTPEDVKANIGLPLLGMVPHVGAFEFELLAQETPTSTRLLEAYRVVRTNLIQGYEMAGAHPLLLITSSREGEGKTTTSCGIAIALARDGKRVLLVDGDLRRASLSKLFSAMGKAGLANVADGTDIRACLTQTSVSGLTLLPTGRLRPNAAEIINRETVLSALESIRSDYDWIICDAPPVLAVADTAILSRLADSVLLVIGANSTPVGAIRASLDQLSAASAKIRGVILNNVDLRDSHYYSYYYSSSYAGYSELPRNGKNKGAPRNRRAK